MTNYPAQEATPHPITNFSLNELLNMSGERSRQGVMRECVVARSDSQLDAFRFPCRIDAFVIGVGRQGTTKVSFNLHDYTLRPNTLFVFGPNHILQMRSDTEFKAHVMVLSPDLLARINLDTKHMMPLFLQFGSHPCLEITDEQRQMLLKLIALVEQQVEGPETLFARDILGGLLTATLYKLGDILHHYLAEHPDAEAPLHSRAEEYFRRFIQLLSEHYRKERTVGFYARQLCITPKYLTTLIKRVSGKTVTEWIEDYVILEAKSLLKYSHMSVQEIAYYLNFPNQSFFGSYFKRSTRLSPSQYKAQQ